MCVTPAQEKILVGWSGGKDSSMALYEIQKSRKYEVAALLTTVTDAYDRISMHSVRQKLLEQQTESLGLRLHKVYISKGASNAEYGARMACETQLKRRLIAPCND